VSIADDVRAAKAARAAEEPAFPEGVWEGSLLDLDALDLPDPELLFTVAGIAFAVMETVVIRGPANVYKSFSALRAVIQAAIDGHTVLLLEGEGSKGATRKRLRRLLAALNVTDPAVRARIRIVQGSFSLTENATAFVARLKRIKPTLVLIDPVVEYNDGDENSAQEMRLFTSVVATAKQIGAAVILVHHSTKPDKDGRTSMRGSSQLRGWVDHEVVIAETSDACRVLITHAKCRERAREPVRSVFWSFTDETIAMSVHAEAQDAVETSGMKANATKLLGVVAEHGPLSVSAARTRLGKVSGETIAKLVVELEQRGRLHRGKQAAFDRDGRKRADVELLYLGPKSGSGTVGVSTDEVSTEDGW
jgi:hypothetical protein